MNKNNLLNAAAFSPYLSDLASAWIGHLPFASWLVKEIHPTVFVELGTHGGHSYFSFCQSVSESGLTTKCYAVDTWRGDEHAGQYGEQVFSSVNTHNDEHYSGFSHLMRMTFDDAALHFADNSIDLLHIDGLHTYEAVRHDFERWLPKLAPGAIVLFHDTAVRGNNFGVWKLWDELCVAYPKNLEFTHSYGLGVLQLNNAPVDKDLEWLHPISADKQTIISYFSSLGSWQLKRHHYNLQINDLDCSIRDLIHSANVCERELAALQTEILRVKSTFSWQITKPLRLLANLPYLLRKQLLSPKDHIHDH